MRSILSTAGLLAALAQVACHSETGLARRVSTEIEAKHLQQLNDPDSYEAVESKYDSVAYTAHRATLLAGIAQQDAAIQANTALIAKTDKSLKDIGYYGLVYGVEAARQAYAELQNTRKEYVDTRTEAKRLRTDLVRDTLRLARLGLTKADTYQVNIKRIYRAKNTAGALQRGAFDFVYFPKRDSLVFVANTPEYHEADAATH